MTPVELHVVSDATGETAARLVQALEAQFPDQEFVEIRHPRVEPRGGGEGPKAGGMLESLPLLPAVSA